MSKQGSSNDDHSGGSSKNTREKLRKTDAAADSTPAVEPILRKEDVQGMIATGIAEAIPIIVKAIGKEKSQSKEKSDKSKSDEVEHDSSKADSDQETLSTKKQKIQKSCNYKTFKMFNPKDFTGDQGAIVALRWLEEMEAIIVISECDHNQRIMYTAHSFKGEALEWWNTLIQVKGRMNMYNLDWEEFKEMVIRKFCPMSETDLMQTKFLSHKMIGTDLGSYNTQFLKYCRLVPHLVTPEYNKVTRYIYGLPREIRDLVRSNLPQSTDSAMELAGYLVNGMIRNLEENKENKLEKKGDGEMKKSKDHKNKRKKFHSSPNTCKTCGKIHSGECRARANKYDATVICTFCSKIGHAEINCRKKTAVCFDCGDT